MKKYLCTTATFALAASFANAVQAQTSIQMFGILDLSIKTIGNGSDRVTQMGTDGMLNSRLGFKAEEDLGGGVKAGAWLESAVNADTGTIYASGKLWHRRSTISLSSSLGELRVGRDLDPTFYNLAVFDPFTAVGVGASFNFVTNLGSGAATLLRADNAVSYFLPPNLGGFYGQVQVAPSEGVAGNRYGGVRVGYAGGPWNTSVAYARTGTATADDFKLLNAGVSYNAGFAKFMVLINNAAYGQKKQSAVGLGVTAPVGASGTLRASYSRADASGAGTHANDARQIAVGYVHHLSKRSALYGTASRLSNRGFARFVTGPHPNPVAGGNSTGVEAGIMHSF